MKIGIIAIMTTAIASALLFSAGPARAGFLLSDPNIIPLSGYTYNYVATQGAKVINSSVEAAVYTKANFELSFGTHAEITNGDYVYVYQMFNAGLVPQTTQAVQFLSVGIASGMAPYDISYTNNGNGALLAPTGPIPASFVSNSTSAKWDFSGSPFLPVNSTSDFLFFASPFPNGTHSATITPSGMLGVNGTLPSPVPEPVAALMLSVFCITGLSARRRRDRSVA